MGHPGAFSFTVPWEWGRGWVGRGSPGDGGTSGLPSSSPHGMKSQWPLWESRLAARLSQDLILLELGDRVHGSSPGMARCALGCSLPQPQRAYGRGNCFYFTASQAAERFLFRMKWCMSGQKALWQLWGANSFPQLPPAPAGCCGPAAPGLCSVGPPLRVAGKGSGARGQPSTEAWRWAPGRPRCAGSSALSNRPR